MTDDSADEAPRHDPPTLDAPPDHEAAPPEAPGDEVRFGYATDGGTDDEGHDLIWSTAEEAGGRYYDAATGQETDPP